MRNARRDAVAYQAESGFNFNKLQAALCIATSSAVSIGLMYLGIRWLS
ncbi:hypothetical protein [Noviherbaspirillum sp. Root189]|nr:hypothetical protein [Noviherbaspirillum sp. Root189]